MWILLIGKDPKAGKDWRQEEKRAAENEMVRQHHRFNGHEREQTPGDSEGQGNLVCCSPWGSKESDMTEWLNNNKWMDYGESISQDTLCSVQFSRSVVSNSLQPQGLQHARPPCPSPNSRVYSNSCPLSWWCYLTISSTAAHFSSWLQSFSASGSSPMS